MSDINLKKIDEELNLLEEKIKELKDENELIKLRIKKKELILMKMELEELK